MTKARRSLRHQRGAAAVEFAIIAPLLFMLIFGITEFGRVWSVKNVLVGAAREGARYAAVECEPEGAGSGCTTALIQDRIRQAAVGYPVSFENFSVTPAQCPAAGGPVTVRWEQDMQIDIPFVPNITLNNVPIEAVFRCE